MKPESIVFAVSGAFFGLIVGWIIGTQQAPGRPAPEAAAVTQAAPVASAQAARPILDESQVTPLKNIAERDPTNVQSRVQLGNLYFDGERYQEAIKWYEDALALNGRDVNVSTDLGVCYYYTDQADRAIAQLEMSLAIDPKHQKSLLNLGVVRAFGKQDIAGAMAAWEKVIAIDPNGQEGQAARRALDNLKSAHPGGAPVPPPGTPPASQSPKPGRTGN